MTMHTVPWLLLAILVVLILVIAGPAVYGHVRTRGDWRRGLPDAVPDRTADLAMALQVSPIDRTTEQQALIDEATIALTVAVKAPAASRTSEQRAVIAAARSGVEPVAAVVDADDADETPVAAQVPA